MLVARYFLFVGAALLALLFVADAELPKLAPANVADTSSDLSAVRIKSERKWPSRVVFDTRIPEPNSVQTAGASAPEASAHSMASAKGVASVAEAAPSESRQSEVAQSDIKPPETKRPLKRRIARRRVVEPTVLAARQAPFGFFSNNIW